MGEVHKFTIVTPSFNQAGYLPETIESVLSQEGPFEIEYIIMDGGSTDGSADIIRTYAERVASGEWPIRCGGITVHWASAKDNGQSDAINKGLRRATGDICSYLNSDDPYPPGALARTAAAFDRHPQADFVYGDGEVIDESSRLQWTWLARPYNHRLLSSYHFAWDAFPNYIMQQATFWRRRAMEKIGYFDESMHFAMDLEYWLRAGGAGMAMVHVPEKLGRFRMIQGTKSLSSPTAFWEDQLELFRRHHGVGRLDRYFCYFYFNVAKHRNFDLPGAAEEAAAVLKRWVALPEWPAIEASARTGYLCSALLAAVVLHRGGDPERAMQCYRFAVRERPRLRFHYLSLIYRIRCSLTAAALARLDKCWDAALAWYRRTRIEYRYFESAT
jgi:glycosyltransferase involved in cell wall biosynthesis